MKVKVGRNNKKIYFSDAMKEIDESIDYNEFSEINSSNYFKETLYKAEDEVDKLMSTSLMVNYKKNKKFSVINEFVKKIKIIFLKIKMVK